MKKVIFSWLLSAMFISATMAQYGATRTGFEGDHFNLEGALELFKDSRSVEDFERRLNTKTNWVNNLDLDYNGRTDYIRVNQRRQGNLNAIILQVPVDRRYVQDIAVIEIEQTGRRQAILQMVGDADLYGENVYIEPYDNNGGTVNVYRWRAVQNVLDGFGNTYASPYAYNNYPTWYSPWNQFAWNVYQPRFVSYRNYYRLSPYNRLANVYSIYSPYRAYCPVISRRTAQVRSQRPPTNRATVQRNTTTRNRATAQTNSRATTRATTQPRATSSRATTSATSRATSNRNRATTATTSRATTSTNRRASTPVTTRSAATRTTRPTTTTRATSQPRRTATTSRAASTRSTATVNKRAATPAKRTVSTRSTAKRTVQSK